MTYTLTAVNIVISSPVVGTPALTTRAPQTVRTGQSLVGYSK